MKKLKTNKIIIIVTVLIVLIISSFYNGLVIKRYTLKSDKINSDLKIILISDLHSHFYGDNQKTIMKKIIKQSPDIILLAGDIIDDIDPIEGAVSFMEQCAQITATYYVTGNHEYWKGNINQTKELVVQCGVVVLDNKKYSIEIYNNRLDLYGIDDPAAIYYDENVQFNSWIDMLDSIEDISKENFSILLSHRPEKIDIYKEYDFDLIVSGHAHGGQVRIPFLINGLYAPDQGWFPEYAGGKYLYNNTTHIVSRGVSYNQRLPRVFNPPEIVVIKLKVQ